MNGHFAGGDLNICISRSDDTKWLYDWHSSIGNENIQSKPGLPQSKVANGDVGKLLNISVMVISISNKHNPRFTVKELFNNNVAYNTELWLNQN